MDDTNANVAATQANIDKLEIGGRNLLRSTSNPSFSYFTNIGYFKEDEKFNGCSVRYTMVEWEGMKFNFNSQIEDRGLVKAGDTFTYSIWAKTSDEETKSINACITAEGILNGEHNRFIPTQVTTGEHRITNEWKRFYYTFTVPAERLSEQNGSVRQLRIEQDINSSDGCCVMWACPKLERGSKPTDWTPSPEDIESDLTELGDRITSAETSIIQNSEAITLKAEKTYVDDIESRVELTESSITQLSNKITANVTETSNLTTRMSTVEQTANGLTVQLSNLEIGGENILVGSREISNVSYGSTSTTLLDNGFTAVKLNAIWAGVKYLATDMIAKCSAGDKFIFSVNVKSTNKSKITFYAMCVDSDGKRVYPSYSSGQFNDKYIATVPEYEDDKRYSIVIPVTQGWIDLVNNGGKVTWTIQLSERTATDAIIYMYAPKLERGNKATDWSPNYNDIYTGIDTAAKTATDFMNFSSSGLIIGDMTAGTLGKNVLIDSDSVDIRNGSTTLASFGATDIYLGKNSETSVINLCNGAATMRVKDNTDFRIYTDKRLVMSAYSSMLLDCWRDSTHMTRISIQSSDPDVSSVVGGVQFTIYQGKIQNTVQMLGNDIINKVTDGTNTTYTTMHESIFKVNTSGTIVLNSPSSVQIGDSSSYSFGIRLGSTFTKNKSINCYWSDGEVHDLLAQSGNGQTCYLGAGDIGEVTNTNIRGKYVRLYAHEGGGVYLGYSGSTAITSDRNMKKDIIDIDDKYIDFFDRLRPITYKYNVGHRDHIGFVAQEVEEALTASGLTTEQFAGLVIERDINLNPNYDSSLSDEENAANETHYDKLYSLRYEEFISLLVKKVQNLQKQIDELKGE